MKPARRLKPDDWRPRGVDSLEPTAFKIVKSLTSQSVLAGPGSGKTELLAQRASFLLETGSCADPQRILAISFKRDAATNLRDRVKSRCPDWAARRFDSMTFDAFCKSLLDRFSEVLPARWRPTSPYEIAFPSSADQRQFLDYATTAAPKEWQTEIANIARDTFEARTVGARALSATADPASGVEWAIHGWIEQQLTATSPSKISFTTVNRLVDVILRASSDILGALRITYPFVFVDEFQDTTFAQFGLLERAFKGSSTVLTAVGDDKQRIMLWAGARADAFQSIEKSFRAVRETLVTNYRSSPALVQIQHHIARAIDAGAAEVESGAASTVDGHVSQIWRPKHHEAEAEFVANWIARDLVEKKLRPRDYALLIRQKVEEVETRLTKAFARHGLNLSNEARMMGKVALQDLLAEDVTTLFLAMVRLIIYDQHAESWSMIAPAVAHLRGLDPIDEVSSRKAESELSNKVEAEKANLAKTPISVDAAKQFAHRLITFFDPGCLRRSYPAYLAGNNLEVVLESLRKYVEICANEAKDWVDFLARFEGVDAVPILTIHKSKGLEYHTVIFLGLDDDQWRYHQHGDPEGTAGFFVAFSRAKQRVYFTCCRDKGRSRVIDLRKHLIDAGVPEVDV